MKRPTAVSVVVGAVALALTLMSCTSGDPTTTPDPSVTPDPTTSGEPAGIFRHAVAPEVGSVNPMSANQPQEIQVITYAYETLIYTNNSGERLPWLAEDWSINDEGTTVTFTLKEGITFHDGTPFDAEVAAANINYHTDPENPSVYTDSLPAGLAATGTGLTLEVSADQGDPFLASLVGGIRMVAAAGLANPDGLETASNGTGLYEMTGVTPGKYTFTTREDYTWGPQGLTSQTAGLPAGLEITVVTDESTRANLLLSGELNAAAVLGADFDRVSAAGYEYVGTINPIGQILFNEREDRPTSDPRVREALILGFKHADAAEVVSAGRAVELTSWITEAPFTCYSETPVWNRPAEDATRAAALLDEAGWTASADGTRARDGVPLSVNFIYDAGAASHAAAAELLSQDWAELGITANLIAMSGADWSEYLYQTFDYDTGWIQIGVGSPVIQHLFYGGAFPEDGGLNFMGVSDPAYDAFAAQALSAADEDEACGYWKQAEKVVVENFHTFLLTGTTLPVFANGASFEITDYLQPVSIRMTP